MSKFLLTKKQFYVYLILCALISARFLILALSLQIKNESGLILILPVFLGLPWSLLLAYLPFDTFDKAGFNINNSGVPDVYGNLITTPVDVILFMIPVYINLFIAFHVINKVFSKTVEEEKMILSASTPNDSRVSFFDINNPGYYKSNLRKFSDVLVGIFLFALLFKIPLPFLPIIVALVLLFGLKKRRYIFYGFLVGWSLGVFYPIIFSRVFGF